jgi:hypothetical protein
MGTESQNVDETCPLKDMLLPCDGIVGMAPDFNDPPTSLFFG